MSCYTCRTAFLALVLVTHLRCGASAIFNHSCESPPVCGNFTKISYPFRLKHDPPNCGDSNFELVCEKNQTLFFNLFAGKYLVKAINYGSSTIRIADAGIHDGSCSSLPLHSLSEANFSFLNGQYYISSIGRLTFLSCETPQKSPLYVDADAYIGKNQTKKKYQYVVLSDQVSDLGDSCAVELVYPMNRSLRNHKNLTYLDVHEDLANGFELDWNPRYCSDCSGQDFCQFNSTTYVVECSEAPCSVFGHISSLHCFFKILGEIIMMASRILYVIITYPILWKLTTFEILVALRFICGSVCLLILLACKWRRRHLSMYDSIEDFLQNDSNLIPIRYSYSEIKKMTNNFKDKLGEGGYGSVYIGKLRSGYLVAIKMLGKSKATGQEFTNEVATIGRIHHVNVVRLIGFCAEGSKRALIYDFMPNGSLDKHIFSKENYTPLSWEKLYEVSLGIARGIEYLHRGCEMQILHFDIKPHNILLDEDFTPKVSDFGLAKLYPTNNSIVTLTAARGTIGYIAPELFYKNIGGVSYKADVYSFGMMLMEMASKRRNINPAAEHSSQIFFPFWAHDQISNGKEMEMEATPEEKKIAEKMILVALWCVQMNPTNRPPMNKVVEMLEGEVESLQFPPKPCLYPEEKFGEDVGGDSNETWSSFEPEESTESASLITSMQ